MVVSSPPFWRVERYTCGDDRAKDDPGRKKNDEMARLVWMKQAYPDEVDDVINDKGKYKIDTNEYKKVIIRKSPSKAVNNKIIKDLQTKNDSINQSNKNSTFRLLETNEDDFYQWSSSSDNEDDDDNSPRYWKAKKAYIYIYILC